MNREALESGTADHGITWQVLQDYDYEVEREFYLIATRGTGRHISVDEICDSMDEFDAALKAERIVYSQPLFMLAHSGVSVSLGGFNDPWDSGQCGFACITKETADLFGLLPDDYESFLKSAVDTYNAYLIGNVIGYCIEQTKKCDSCGHTSEEHLDSCWGFVITRGWGGMDEFVKDTVMPQVQYFVDKFNEAEHQAEKGVKSDD